MLSNACIDELRTGWFPHLTDSGLSRLAEMLEKGDPLLFRGSWAAVSVQGCLATHAGWHHPATSELGGQAGFVWLRAVAGIDPLTSYVLSEWDHTQCDWQTRAEFLAEFRGEQRRREATLEPCDREARLTSRR